MTATGISVGMFGEGGFNPLYADQQTQQNYLAERKARALLMQKLTPTQRQMFEKHGHFFVKGETGSTYKIGPNHAVERVNPRQRYCVYVNDNLPLCDQLLGFKLYIESNEAEFLKKA